MNPMDGAHRSERTHTSRGKLTYEDFLLFPDDGQRHELIDGEHYVTPSPNIRHQQLSVRLTTALATYFVQHPIGQVFHAPLDCVMSDSDVVDPDLLVVLTEQTEILTHQHVRGVPAIVMEILSPGTRRVDERAKRDLYDRAGVREYWIVDPQDRQITIHRREAGEALRKTDVLTADGEDALTTPLLPGFRLTLAGLFQ